MKHESVNLLTEIDSISKIHKLHRGDIDKIMIEFAQRLLTIFRIERMGVWLFNAENDAIVSIGEYDLVTRAFTKGSKLTKQKYPLYFQAICDNEIYSLKIYILIRIPVSLALIIRCPMILSR